MTKSLNKWYRYLVENQEPGSNLRMTEDMKSALALTTFVFQTSYPKNISPRSSPIDEYNGFINDYKEAYQLGIHYLKKITLFPDYDTRNYDPTSIWNGVVGDDKWSLDDNMARFEVHKAMGNLDTVYMTLWHPSAYYDPQMLWHVKTFLIVEHDDAYPKQRRYVGFKPKFVERFDGATEAFQKLRDFFDKLERLDPDYSDSIYAMLATENAETVAQATNLINALVGDVS